MKVPISWLKDYVDIDVTPKKLADELTLSGSKVETIEELGKDIKNVVVGKIISAEKHPDADKLQITKVDVGDEILQIVTGAANIKVGDYIPTAKDGAKLPGGKEIHNGVLRGVESCGMMCSIQELGFTRYDFPEAPEHGIFILEGEPKLGADIREVMGLNDTVIEFEITPNRPDCLSIVGIARETAVTLGKTLSTQHSALGSVSTQHGVSEVSVEILDPDLCSRYVGRIVRNVKIGPSPEWIKRRLRAAGVRPISNLVDITNYVMLELGQPMHAFDFDKIEKGKIVVRRAKSGETIATLDGQERVLKENMLVIADASKPVAVAGIMGGANSEVTEDTTTILLESATFNGSVLRLAAKALGLRTEASARYEKGLDVENTVRAMNRAVELLEQIGAGKADKSFADCYPVKKELRTIKLRPERINAFLGTNIDTEYMIKLFGELEFKVDKSSMTVTVPSFRSDVEGEADLAEEIARFYGYNKIESTLFSGATTQGVKTFKQKVEDVCKNVLISQGLAEVYNYSFINPKALDMIRIEQSSELRKMVEIINPLSEEQKVMRSSTIPSMMETLARNYARRISAVRFFELSYEYIPKAVPITELPDEREIITIGMYGKEDFYSIKGIVEELLFQLGISEYSFEREGHSSFHPGRTAKLVVGGNKIGTIGEVHPEVLDNYDINTRAYVGVIEFYKLLESVKVERLYKQLPKYPVVDRDIAMVVKDTVTVGDIEKVIASKGGDLLEHASLFDVYKGNQIAEGYKSVAYSLSFRASDRTLTDEEVNVVMKAIMDELKNKLDAQLRE